MINADRAKDPEYGARKAAKGQTITLADQVRWPTPLATDGKNGGPNSRGSKGDLRLSAAVHQFPTPCARDYRSPNNLPFSERGGGKKGEQLVNFIAHFPTPTVTNTKANHMRGADKGKAMEPRSYFPTPRAGSKSGGGSGLDGGSGARKTMVERFGAEEAKALGSGGQLNPPWVEWLMGWPIGWTDLKPLETAKFQQWPHSHSELSNIA